MALLTLPLLGVWVASALIALNWHALGRKGWALWAWVFIPLSLVWGVFVFSYSSALGVMFGSFLLWPFLQALPQIWHVRQYSDTGYQKRRWIIPIGLGLIFTFAWPKAVAALNHWFTENEGPKASASVVPPPQAPVKAELTVEEVIESKAGLVYPVEVCWSETSYLIFTSNQKMRGSAVQIGTKDDATFLITNKHVAEVPAGSSKIDRHLLLDGKPVTFEVVSYASGDIDLALLKVPLGEHVDEKWIPVATMQQIAVGQECVAIGNTLGEGISVTTGIISKFDDVGPFTAIRTHKPRQ